MGASVTPVLILGGTGQLGSLLRLGWPWAMRAGLRPIWQARRAVPGCLTWDILHQPAPSPWAGGIVLSLAGGRADPGAEVALALAALDAATAQGARHVFLASSAAVYGPGEALAEEAEPAPVSAYGRSKLAMEQAALDRAARGGPGLTLLRIGNVAGADALLGPERDGPVPLTQVPGQEGGPLRSYIGPSTFSAVLARLVTLAAEGQRLPSVLNIATPRPVSMAALLDAAGIPRVAASPDPATPARVVLDTRRLQTLIRLPPYASSAVMIVKEWRALLDEAPVPA